MRRNDAAPMLERDFALRDPALTALKDFLRRRSGELRLALRTTIAAGLAFAVAKLLDLPQGTWAVITAIIVMQASLGGSVKAAADRMAGTLAGALWGGLVAVSVPRVGDIETGLAVLLAVGPLALLAAVNASFRVAPITALIVLLPTSASGITPLAYALERIAEISLGIVVGVGVALFVLPARARGLLAKSAARLAELNADLVEVLIEGLIGGEGRPGLAGLHARIRATLRQMDAAVDEAARERRTHLSDHADPEPLARTLYRVRHDLVMIGRACATPLPPAIGEALREPLTGLRDRVAELLRDAARSLRLGLPLPDAEAFAASLAAYIKAMDTLRAEGATRELPGEEAGRIYALRFGFEQLGDDLTDLLARAGELAKP